ncbi:ABC transporter substrate-binding protein [Aestuariispira insulae]|uniref:Putative thiamine transport system substrate-binding protein n=1 Tax=Aestuariispira insulae TaxID=1461337 RepID=A0A3D9HP11_9PROT|nr:ABC transporter substrate-binding protein [Aestuariispira insulae]RED51233.1 putative thiamine transport system substrate-binding protein [Aestuariispira insulae]
MGFRNWIAGAAATLIAATTHTGIAGAGEWSDIMSKAKGQTVYWNAWGGGDSYNAYIAWVGERVSEEYGVNLVHVKLGDTAEAVRKVLAERTAGRTDDGTVDLIWINGENFKAMKDADLLYGPWVENLPNFQLVDTALKPTTILDFTVPTEGLEAPWGMAKLIFIHDSARLENPPKSMPALLDYARTSPGRISYPAPPDFHGSTFLKQALMELSPNRDALLQPAGNNFDQVTAPLWSYLDSLSPHLWKAGKEYPRNGDQMIQMLDDGSLDVAFSFNIGAATNAIKEGLLPESTRSYVLEGGTIGNTHFVAIPFNAAHKEAAMVVANFLMSPEAQARKQDPNHWGEQTVLAYQRLSAADKALFDAIPRGVATLSDAELGATLPEPHPSWMTMIEEAWLRRYGS